MPAAGTTSELYIDPANPASTLGAAPSAPSPIPPPPAPTPVVVQQQPVIVKGRMADEGADGRVRDTSMEAVTNPNRDLGFRNLDAPEAPVATEPTKEAAQATPAATEAPKVETPAAPAQVDPAAPPKVYAGKFKSIEELERGYEEAQKLITKQGQERAAFQQAQTVAAAAPVKTPEQQAADAAYAAAENNRILSELTSNPKEFIERNVIQRVTTALTAQQIAEQWRKSNADIAEHEVRVAFEATLLAQSDPEIARNPAALLNKATDNFRSFTGKLRSEGAREALTTETRVIPLLSNTAPSAATEQPPQKAPLTFDDSFSAHLKMLKEQEQKSHRGLRR